MNSYKHIALQELNQFTIEHPDLTLAQTLYSALRPKVLKKGQEQMNWLLSVTDEELYEAFEQAKLIENE